MGHFKLSNETPQTVPRPLCVLPGLRERESVSTPSSSSPLLLGELPKLLLPLLPSPPLLLALRARSECVFRLYGLVHPELVRNYCVHVGSAFFFV